MVESFSPRRSPENPDGQQLIEKQLQDRIHGRDLAQRWADEDPTNETARQTLNVMSQVVEEFKAEHGLAEPEDIDGSMP